MAREEIEIGDPDGPNPQAWMLTFSDLLTLMLTFFVLLFSMSSLDERALKEITVVDVLAGGDGVLHAGDPDRLQEKPKIKDVNLLRSYESTLSETMAQYLRTVGRGKSDESRRKLEERLASRKMQDDVEIRVLDDGLEISFNEDEGLFGTGEGTMLNTRARAKLQLISDAVVESGARAQISVPTKGDGLSQWLKASRKSGRLAHHLRRQAGVGTGRSRISVHPQGQKAARKVKVLLTMPNYADEE